MTDLSTLLSRVESGSGADRFWSKVRVSDASECWPWLASKNHKGYGQISVGSRADGTYRSVRAHRLAYELCVRPLAPGEHIDHVCRNRACCNPAHLDPVTPAENNKRAGARRVACPSGHALTPDSIYVRGETRECRQCRIERKRRYRRERREAALIRAEMEKVK